MIDLLTNAMTANDSLLCVGLDPDLERIPDHLRGERHPLFAFNREIVDATAAEVCAFKPQFAYYAANGLECDLELTVEYIKTHYSDIPVILDAKRGDIGPTAERYAEEAFRRYGVDAVTVNPYLGFDTIEPYLHWPDKGVIVLCRTSNPGAGFLQDLQVGGERIYELVARRAAELWQDHRNLMLVVGATWPEELRRIREIAGEMTFLVPGVGAQGADVGQVVQNGLNRAGRGVVISSSRGIIYAGSGRDFQRSAFAEARRVREEINRARAAAGEP